MDEYHQNKCHIYEESVLLHLLRMNTYIHVHNHKLLPPYFLLQSQIHKHNIYYLFFVLHMNTNNTFVPY